jgi:hypothetical protein
LLDADLLLIADPAMRDCSVGQDARGVPSFFLKAIDNVFTHDLVAHISFLN